MTGQSGTSEPLAQMLRRLSVAARRVTVTDRKTTLFEALNVLDSECPHSDYLAWLLDPAGPLDGGWLLTRLLTHVGVTDLPGGEPIVEREVRLADGRLDIRVSWDAFKLVIENKVWSAEGDRQVARYLDGAEIASQDVGKLVYLTPDGDWPRSVERGDPRVVAVSYGQLADLLTTGLAAVPPPVGRAAVFATEYRDSVNRLLQIEADMDEPPRISESTAIYLHNVKRLAAVRKLATRESIRLISWLRAAIEARLRLCLGADMECHRGRYVTIYHRPEWRQVGVVFGFQLGFDVDPREQMFTERPDGPWAGVGAWPTDDDDESEQSQQACRKIVAGLESVVRPIWPQVEDPDYEDWSMALWSDVRPNEGDDLNRWADGLLDLFAKMAEALAEPIHALATRAGAS